MSELLNAALGYARRGLTVFPLACQGKKPLTRNGLKDASACTEQIEAWWSQWPGANVGVPTGQAQGFFVLDIDGDEGEASLRRLEAANSSLPATAEVITGGGGRHIYLAWPEGGEIANSASRLGTGLDIRGNGGYVVAPPSVHSSGRKYQWSVDSDNHISAAPLWLLELIRKPTGRKPSKSPDDWLELLAGAGEGRRNDAVARITGLLLRKHIPPRAALQLVLGWNSRFCTPPLPDAEIFQTVNSIAGKELARRRGI